MHKNKNPPEADQPRAEKKIITPYHNRLPNAQAIGYGARSGKVTKVLQNKSNFYYKYV